jgi:hypothetical protein
MHQRDDAIRDVPRTKMEMTMRRKILTMLVVPLVAALTAQAAAASGYHHMRTKGGTVASEQIRNSNAYAPPRDIAVPSDSSRYQGQALVPGAY